MRRKVAHGLAPRSRAASKMLSSMPAEAGADDDGDEADREGDVGDQDGDEAERQVEHLAEEQQQRNAEQDFRHGHRRQHQDGQDSADR